MKRSAWRSCLSGWPRRNRKAALEQLESRRLLAGPTADHVEPAGDGIDGADRVTILWDDKAEPSNDLDPSFALLDVGGAERATVNGSVGGGPQTVIDSEGFESGSLDAQWTTFSSRPHGRIVVAGDNPLPAAGSYALSMDVGNRDDGFNLNEATWTVDLSGVTAPKLQFSQLRMGDKLHPLPADFTGSVDGDGVAISDDGVRWHTVFTPPQQVGIANWDQYTIDLGAEAATAGMVLGPAFQIKFQQYDDLPSFNAGRAFDEIMVFTVEPTENWYRFTLTDGQSASLALSMTAPTMTTPSDVTLGLYDRDLNPISTGLAATNADWIIDDFVDATSDGSPSTYYARLWCEFGGDYRLVVTRDAGLEVEPNNGLGPLSGDLSPSGVLLGHAGFGWGEPIPEEKLTALDAELEDEFGYAVAISGDTAMVGAPAVGGRRGGGALYVYRFDGNRWTQQQKLEASPYTEYAKFGTAVDMDGDVAIVGAPGTLGDPSSEAYVFRFDGTRWVQEQELIVPSIIGGENFGWSVSISGDRAIVGSVLQSGRRSGRAYVFNYDGSQWVLEQELLVPDIDEHDNYGHTVSISGTTAVVGAPGFLWRSNNAHWPGAVHVFQYNGSQWVQQQKIVAAEVPDDGSFASSVSIDGDTLVVGAGEDEDPSGHKRGSAIVYRYDGDQWVRQQKLRIPGEEDDPFLGSWFGRRVQLDGNRFVVSAPLYDEPGEATGAAYLFEFDGQQWQQRLRLEPSGAAAGDHFSAGVAISGDTVIVGAPENDVYNLYEDVYSGPGSAHVFRLSTPHDDYALGVLAGDELTVSTTTPGDGPGEFANLLDPRVELYAPDGSLAAEDDNGAPDGRNAMLTYTATMPGIYTARVLRGGQAEGEYILAVTGHTGPPPAFEVAAIDLADGSRLPSVPSRLTVQFNDLVLMPTLDASDLTVGGLAATEVSWQDGRTVVFGLLPLAEGTHEVAMAGGAVVDLQGTPLEPFTSQIIVDLTPPRVVESSLLAGDVVGAGTLVYTARFDEELDAAALDRSDVELSGPITGIHQPSLFDYDPVTSTLTVEYLNLMEDTYTLRLLSGDGRFQDVATNVLDGEPHPATTVPSGDGTAGGDFVVQFTTDVDDLLFPVQLIPKAPRGSLIFDGSTAAVIHSSNDTDSFTIEFSAGQTITAVVVPEMTLRPSVELLDPNNDPLGAAVASAAGEDVLVQTAAVAASGAYTITVGSLAGTAGTYTLYLTLNAAVQEVMHGGPPNDTPASAQDLDAGFITLDGEQAQRTAVLGRRDWVPGETIVREDFESGTLDGRWGTYSSLPDGRVEVTGAHGTGGGSFALLMDHLLRGSDGNLNEAIWTVDLSGQTEAVLSFRQADWLDEVDLLDGDFSGHRNADGVAISDDGIRWHPVWTPTRSQPLGVWAPYAIDLGAEAAEAGMTLGPDFRVKFQQYDNLPIGIEDPNIPHYSQDGRGYDEIMISVTAPWEGDWYRFTLHDGRRTAMALASFSPGDIRLELYDAAQNLLETGVDAANVDQVIQGFADATADGLPETYYLRVSGTGEDYGLVVTRSAVLDVEPNSTQDNAQELSSAAAAMGYLVYPVAASSDAEARSDTPTRETPAEPADTAQSTEVEDGRYVPGRLIVRFADAKTDAAKAELVQMSGAKVLREFPSIDAALIQLPDAKADVPLTAAQWSAHPSVLYAEPDFIDPLDTVPNDPMFSELWALYNTGQAGRGSNWGLPDPGLPRESLYGDVDALAAWDLNTGSPEVVVAVIDTGVDYTHEDLAANMWRNPGEIPDDGIDNDGNGYVDDVYGINADGPDSDPMDVVDHGSHVAGIIGAVGGNGIGTAGVNWNVRIMALRAGDSTGLSASSQIACLEYMTMMKTSYGVNVVASNNSYGGSSSSQARKDAIEASADAGIMFVASAGNSGVDNDHEPHYPSNYDLDGIIAVAATDPGDGRTGWSNYGTTSVDLGAPGYNILSTIRGNEYEIMSGTSMAAPYVTGAVALLAAQHPDATLAEIKAMILRGADPVPDLWYTTLSGGRLNLANALAERMGNRGDYYRLEVDAGDVLAIGTVTPQGGPGVIGNLLDPALQLYDPSGNLIAGDDNGAADGRNAQLVFPAGLAGTYVVRVVSMAGQGEYVLSISTQDNAVVGRHVFYNNSAFDGNNADPNPADDNAIAPDPQSAGAAWLGKTALLPGGTATFQNYTSYSRGINGIMIDIAGVPDGVTVGADDLQLRVGNSNDPSAWAVGPTPSDITVRRGDGVYGSDRITLIWPDNAIGKQWLQVTVLATANTGLTEPDVFYYGNAIGESGNSPTDAKVNVYEMLGARNNQRNFLDPAPIDFNFDFNRDARVNVIDLLIARNNQTHFLNTLKLITVPAGKAAGEQASAVGRRAVQDAVFRQAVEREPERPATASNKLDWLHEFDQMSTQKRPSKRDQSAEAAAAADEVLVMNLL